MIDVDQQEEMGHIISESVGEILKAARENAGWSITDVSEKLHLQTHFIAALETDDHDALPSRVFALGYLRKYARLLGLDAEKLVEVESSIVPDKSESVRTLYQPREKEFGVSRYAPRRKKGVAGKLGGLLLIIILLLVATAWLMGLFNIPGLDPNAMNQMLPFSQQEEQDNSSIISELSSSDTTQPDAVMLELNAEIPQASQDMQLPQETVSPETVVSDAVIPLQIEELSTPDETANSEGALAEINRAEIPVTETSLASGEQPAQTVVEKGIVLEFEKDCWVDVRNEHGIALLNGMYDAGSVEILDASGSVSFILGDASAVVMYVNGEKFDIHPYVKGNVARFTYQPGSNR